jgi:hypothetical protein
MNSFQRTNTILGWFTFAASFLVYLLTLEPSVSLWDCGEFLSASYKLQVVHPPGAPFFLLLGRLFSLFAPSTETVAFAINAMSGAASAGCVMFTFWITTYLAGKILGKTDDNSTEEGSIKNMLIFGAGLVAAFTNTFIDSFWFSAVEAEVYALSSFFTALTFWAVLRWEKDADLPGGDRWLVLIAYLTGLAIGTHLLNLLVIPAIAFVYYFRRYEVNRNGIIITSIVALGILGFIMKGIIPGTVWYLAHMDKLFVNGFGMPFYSGVIFGLLLLAGALAYGIWYSIQNKRYYLNLAMMSLSFVMLGYSTYAMVVLRSMANPAIDMNNPQDMFNLLSYINREQYGDRPLLYGPYFNAPPVATEEKGEKWFAGEKEYELAGPKYDYKYDEKYMTLFPRMGKSRENDEIGYRVWGGMANIQGQINALNQRAGQGGLNEEESAQLQALKAKKPNFANNLRYFFSYQLYYMYIRYFMWNFVGRQNDQQAMLGNTQFDGNWKSGIGPVDYMNLGPQKNLPKDLAQNKASNQYYFLPLILGILGVSFHFKRRKLDAWVVMILFLFTGILINIYMNQPPFEPRERDYSVVGSFQTFCIWVGLGVLAMAELLRRYINFKTAAMVSVAAAFIASPVIMAAENWDDHDRSKRYLGIDFAKNYLQCCPPNAILFTNGDNDTYPLWYAQNVEGIRTDVRIINMSLLPTEWYSSVLLDKVYNSEPLPLSLTRDDLKAGRFEYGIAYQDMGIPEFDENRGFSDGRKVLNYLLGRDASNINKSEVLPTRKIRVPVNRKAIIDRGIVLPEDTNSISPFIDFTIPGRFISKGDLVLIDLVVTNAERGWERPICFTTTSGYDFKGLNEWLQNEGLCFRLVPVKGGINREERGRPAKLAEPRIYDNIMKFGWCGMKEKKNFFLDDKAQLVPQSMQQLVLSMGDYYSNEIARMASQKKALDSGLLMEIPAGLDAASFSAQLEEKMEYYRKRGVTLLDLVVKEIPENVLAYRNEIRYFYSMLYLELGEEKKGEIWMDKCFRSAEEFAKFFKQYNARKNPVAGEQYNQAMGIMQSVQKLATDRGKTALAEKYQKSINQISRP